MTARAARTTRGVDSCGAGGGRRGFTVVEMLTALVLTAAALSLTAAVFRLALMAQERGTARMELLQRADAALEMMARDLHSAINLGSDTEAYIFQSSDDVEGEIVADTLGFVSTVNNPRAGAGIAYDLARIEYYIDLDPDTPETGLVRRQLNFPLPDDEEERESAARLVEMLPTADSLSILLYDNASGEWVENWDEMTGVPGAVKLELVMRMVAQEQEQEEEEGEEEAQAAQTPPETKTLTLLVQLLASRYEPTEVQGPQVGTSESGGQGGQQEQQGAGSGQQTGGSGGSGGTQIPQIPQAPQLPSQGTGGGGGGGR